MKIDRGASVGIVLLAGVLFGTTGTATVLANVDASSTAIAAARLGIGALGLVGLSLYQRDFSHLVVLWKLPRVWVMGASVASYMGSFFLAVHLAGAAVASLVSISLAPMLAGTIARMFGKPWPGKVWVVSTVLAVIGVVLLSAPTGTDGGNRVLGALAAAIAAASYAFYTVMGANLVEDQHHATDALSAAFSIGAVILLPFLLADHQWLMTAKGLSLAFWLGLASTTLSYFLFGIGITHLLPGVVATLLLSEPFVATMLGVFIIGEPMAARGWFGCLLIVAGLVMVSRNESRQSSAVVVGISQQLRDLVDR